MKFNERYYEIKKKFEGGLKSYRWEPIDDGNPSVGNFKSTLGIINPQIGDFLVMTDRAITYVPLDKDYNFSDILVDTDIVVDSCIKKGILSEVTIEYMGLKRYRNSEMKIKLDELAQIEDYLDGNNRLPDKEVKFYKEMIEKIRESYRK